MKDGDAEILAKFNGSVKEPEDNSVIPEIVDTSGAFKQKVPEGIGKSVSIPGIPGDMLKTVASPKEKELPAELPLIIQIKSTKEPYSSANVTAVWLFCNLQLSDRENPDTSGYNVMVLKKTL